VSLSTVAAINGISKHRGVGRMFIVGISLVWILTDRRTEHCGNVDRHQCQLHLPLNDIEHPTKAKNPQRNGIFERFRRTELKNIAR